MSFSETTNRWVAPAHAGCQASEMKLPPMLVARKLSGGGAVHSSALSVIFSSGLESLVAKIELGVRNKAHKRSAERRFFAIINEFEKLNQI
ncbi:MAG: hypothetical protein ACKVU0_07420 [Saprospiraceae bacterium]